MSTDNIQDFDFCSKTDLTNCVIGLSNVMMKQFELFEEIRSNQSRQIEIMEITNKMLMSDNLQEASEVVLKELCTRMGFTFGVIKFFDFNMDNFLDIKSIYCPDNDNFCLSEMTKPFSKVLKKEMIERIFANNKILSIEDVKKYNDSQGILQKLQSIGAKSALLVPIFYHNSPTAIILLVNNKKKVSISDNEHKTLKTILPRLSMGLSLFKLNDDYKKSFEIEIGLRDIISQIRNIKDSDGIFDVVMKYLLDVLDVDGAVRFFVDENDKYKITNIISKDPVNLEGVQKTGVIVKIFRDISQEKIVISDDVKQDLLSEEMKKFLLDRKVLAFMSYPNFKNPAAYKKFEDIGFLAVYSKKPRTWLSDEIHWFSLIIDTVSIVYSEMKQKLELEETRKNFVMALTHDLKAPIIAVQKALEVIMDKYKDIPFLEHLQEIYKTNTDLINMTNNLLSVYHYESFEYSLFLEKTDIKQIITEALNLWRYLCDEKNCKFTLKINQDLPMVYVDRREIKRVFSNLISNAVKHAGNNTEITIGIKNKQKELEIYVKDNGEGISKEDAANIFNRYFSHKREIGTGLGLFIVKQIVEAHKGKIWLDTALKKGTAFYFTIPVPQSD